MIHKTLWLIPPKAEEKSRSTKDAYLKASVGIKVGIKQYVFNYL